MELHDISSLHGRMRHASKPASIFLPNDAFMGAGPAAAFHLQPGIYGSPRTAIANKVFTSHIVSDSCV